MEQAHVDWCERLWTAMREGAVWAVPRTGLVFQRTEGKLVLISRYDEPALRARQDEDLEGTREHFAEFGVEVVWNDSA